MIASKINLGKFSEKKKSPKQKIASERQVAQRKLNPFCLAFGVKAADKMADKPESCLPNKNTQVEKSTWVRLVLLTGLEPVRCLHRGILSPLRLPIPPQQHIYIILYSGDKSQYQP